MKKSVLNRLVFSALTIGTLAFLSPAEAAIQVNPIPNLPANFIKGADVSMLPEMESLGAKFYDIDGTPMDALQIMKNHGINWIRVRIWNNPKDGPGGGGNTTEERAIEMAKRAKALGLKVLVDFHYSDWWADPGKQHTPKAWEKHDKDQLVKDVYEYTTKVLNDFKAAGVTPQMVQVGNEVKSGMLWPIGKLPSTDGDKAFADLMRSGLKAVRDFDAEHNIQLMVHLPDGGDNAFYQSFFDSLIKKHGVNDFDIIGLSYYPFWHGTLEQLQTNLNDTSKRYNKDVIVVETAFGYTNENFDEMKNCYGKAEERIGGFRSTVQGQASGLRAVMERLANVPGGKGTGMFYWEPDWYAVKGAGWKTGEGNEWDNLAMFDKNGKALESWNVYTMVSDKNGRTIMPAVKEVDDYTTTGGVDIPITMPEKVMVAYTDDHTENLPVTWDNPKPVFHAIGEYTVKGTVQGIHQSTICKVKVIKKANLLQNGNFEKVTLDGWKITGSKGAVDAVSKAGDSLGQGSLHYWADKPFEFTASQEVTGLKPGKYTATVSAQGGGGQMEYRLFIIGDNGEKKTVDIKDTKWNEWHTFEIKDVEIHKGTAAVGIEMKAPAGTWGSVDDFELYLQE